MSDAPAILTIMVSVAGGWALMTGGNANKAPHAAPATPLVSADDGRNDAITIRQGSDGYFYADARVNGAPIRFLVDTGANTTVLLREDAKKAGMPVLAPVALRTAGNSVQAAHSRIRRLEIGNTEIADLPAVIVDGGIHASLIGTNALAKLGPVRLDGDQIKLD